MKPEVIVVVTSVPDMASAQALARTLVDGKLAACVNLIPGVQSIYRWQGEIIEAGEVTLLIKTLRARYAQLEAVILHNHPYELPEIIVLPTAGGLPAYFDWVAQASGEDVIV